MNSCQIPATLLQVQLFLSKRVDGAQPEQLVQSSRVPSRASHLRLRLEPAPNRLEPQPVSARSVFAPARPGVAVWGAFRLV
jgi:hypothetical protein